jgi:YD repeat-containing protein
VFEWERDEKNHWRVLESGEKAEEAAHTMEDVLCTVCGTEIWLFEDGCADLNNYNEQYDLLRSTSFDENGAVVYDNAFAYGYDEQGCKLWEKQYESKKLVAQTVYQVTAEGASLPVWSETYFEDGTWGRNEYDAYGNCVRLYSYNADGTVLSEESCEYAETDFGWYYMTKSTVNMEGTIFIGEYNEYGDRTRSYIAEPDGTVLFDTVFIHEYEEGILVSSKNYESGVLSWETYYNADGMIIQEIEYLEDGSIIVYDYDEEGNLIEE